MAFFIYSTRHYCAYCWCATNQHFQVFLLFARRRSQLYAVSHQTDIGIGICHYLYTLTEGIVPTSGVYHSNTFKYFYSWPGGGLNSLECQLRLTMLLEFGILIYSTRSYCAYFWCETLQHFQVFLLFVRRGSQLFGLSVQTDNGISISHSLYTLPEDIVPTSGVKLKYLKVLEKCTPQVDTISSHRVYKECQIQIPLSV